MSNYQEVEDYVYEQFKNHEGQGIELPEKLKIALGLGSTVINSVDSSISQRNDSKTDVLVIFDDGGKLKISVKKDNADYYGNWYTHQRIEKEFGVEALNTLIDKTTEWANNWLEEPTSSFFLGVSINFGARSGKTFMEFNDVFDINDLRTIVCGYDESLDTSANILFHTDGNINNIDDVILEMKVIDDVVLSALFDDIKIIFRPINPMTEGSNRGKQTFTKFLPDSPFRHKTLIDKKEDLLKLGRFVEVDLEHEYRLNHNKIIQNLDSYFNMTVRVK